MALRREPFLRGDGMAETTTDLQRSIFRAKILRARGTEAFRKIADAAALFDASLALMRDAIATDNPALGPEQVQAEVLRRLRIARRLDDVGIYEPAGTIDDEP